MSKTLSLETVDQHFRPIRFSEKSTCLSMRDDGIKVDGSIVTRSLKVDGCETGTTMLNIIHAGWYASTTGKVYMPLNGYIVEKTSVTSSNEYIAIVAPFSGQLKRVIIRSEIACGTGCEVGLHISTNGTEVPNSTATHTKGADMLVDDTSYPFKFENATFNAGEILAVSFSSSNKSYDTNAVLVFEYNIKEGLDT